MSFISFVGACNRWGTDNLLDGVGNGWGNMFGCHFRLVLSTRSRWHFQRKKVQTNDFIYRKSNSKQLKQSIFCQKMIACTGYREIDWAFETCRCCSWGLYLQMSAWPEMEIEFHQHFILEMTKHLLQLCSYTHWSYSFKENRTKKSILILQDWLMSQWVRKFFQGVVGGFKGIILFGGGGVRPTFGNFTE